MVVTNMTAVVLLNSCKVNPDISGDGDAGISGSSWSEVKHRYLEASWDGVVGRQRSPHFSENKMLTPQSPQAPHTCEERRQFPQG